MPRVILVALVVFATIYALVDCLQTDGRRIRIMPKPVWLLVCLVPVLGPIMWLVAGKSDAPGSRGLGQGPAPRGNTPRRIDFSNALSAITRVALSDFSAVAMS